VGSLLSLVWKAGGLGVRKSVGCSLKSRQRVLRFAKSDRRVHGAPLGVLTPTNRAETMGRVHWYSADSARMVARETPPIAWTYRH
jgi:hypothetical protein